MEYVLHCNICDKTLDYSLVETHVASRIHSIMKKVAEYNEMNALIGRSYLQDVSVVRIWARDIAASESIRAQA
jgi:hypothetical protein